MDKNNGQAAGQDNAANVTTTTNARARVQAPFHALAVPVELPAWATPSEHKHAGAMLIMGAGVDGVPVAVATLGAGLPAGDLLAAIQGQQDLARARGMAGKLARTMARAGRTVSHSTIDDGAGAGVLAVIQWRHGQPMPGAQHGAAGVCWRAVVASMSADGLGETLCMSDLQPGDLASEAGAGECWIDSNIGEVLPMPGTWETRADAAARLTYERTRAKRPALLARRIEHLKATRGGRGRRGAAWDKLHRAASELLAGAGCEAAAIAAGFRDIGRTSAGDQLRRAARRMGFKFQFDVRMTTSGQAGRTSHTMGAGLPASYAAQLTARPSESLPAREGGTGADKLRRIARRVVKVESRKARDARQARLVARAIRDTAKRASEQRRAARRFAKSGLWPVWSLTAKPSAARWL